MRDYAWALSVLSTPAMTACEKVGHLRLAFDEEEGNNVENHLKLISNFRWFSGPHPVVNRIRGGFDQKSRVFWFSFERTDYFDYGGRAAISEFLAGLKKFGGLAVAGRGDDQWWGVFPAARRMTVATSPEIKAAGVEEEEQEEETAMAPASRPVFVPKVVRRKASV